MSIGNENSLPISNSNNGYLIVQTALKILNLSLNWRFLIFCFVELWFPKYHYFEYHGYVKVIKKCRTPFLFVLYPQYLETLTIRKLFIALIRSVRIRFDCSSNILISRSVRIRFDCSSNILISRSVRTRFDCSSNILISRWREQKFHKVCSKIIEL